MRDFLSTFFRFWVELFVYSTFAILRLFDALSGLHRLGAKRTRDSSHQQRRQSLSAFADTTLWRIDTSSIPTDPPPADAEAQYHRLALASLTLLGQHVPSLMGGYNRPTLQSVYGEPFTALAAAKRRREAVETGVWLYRTRSPRPPAGADAALLVWLVMPWESESPAVQRFALRLAQSLGCHAVLLTVAMDAFRDPTHAARRLLGGVEAARRAASARRVLLGGGDLAATFALLLLEHWCRRLAAGAFAAAGAETACRALCEGVILVDPFVGWDADPARGGGEGGEAAPPRDRFKQVVMSSSRGHIRRWFPSPITYHAPPMVFLVNETGFWIDEQCDFNARVHRHLAGGEERVFLLPYAIEHAAAGSAATAASRAKLEKLWRMVEKFLAEQLTPAAGHVRETLTTTPQRNDGRRAGEVTFLAAFPTT